MGDLIEMLEELRDAVNQVNAPEKLRSQTDNADHFIQQLDTRVRLSEERESVIKHAKLVERSLGAERKESKALLKKLNVQIKREQQERLTLTEQIERRNEERLAAVRALEPHEISALELSDQYDRLLAIDCEMGCAALRADKSTDRCAAPSRSSRDLSTENGDSGRANTAFRATSGPRCSEYRARRITACARPRYRRGSRRTSSRAECQTRGMRARRGPMDRGIPSL